MKKNPSEKMQDQGRFLAMNGSVVSLKRNLIDEAWYAKIIDQEIRHVKLDMNNEKDVCTCLDWTRFGICRHICAVETYLHLEGKSRGWSGVVQPQEAPKKKESQTMTASSSFLLNNLEALEEKFASEIEMMGEEPLGLEVFLEEIPCSKLLPENNLLGLGLRIGPVDGKKLRVKNIKSFFESYTFGQECQLTPNVSYYVDASCFDEETVDLLDYLKKIYHSSLLVQEVENKQLEKSILLPVFGAESIIERLNTRDGFSYQLNYFKGNHIEIKNDEKFINCEVKVSEKSTIMFNYTPTHQYFSAYHWIILHDEIIQLSEYHEAVYRIWRELWSDNVNKRIYFTKKNYREVLSKVVPVLSKVGYLSFKDVNEEQFMMEGLKAELHFELRNGNICAEPIYRYGAAVFSKNEASQVIPEDGIVIRDTYRESQIERLLKHFNYEEMAEDYEKKFPRGHERYDFFTKEVKKYQQIVEVYLSSELEELFVEEMQEPPKLTIAENDSWLDISFDITSIEKKEIQKVLEAIINKQSYVELQNGQIWNLEDESFSKTAKVLQDLRERITLREDGVRIRSYHGVEVQERFSEIADLESQIEFSEMVNHLKNPEQYPVGLPKGINATLRDYQKVGFRWMKMLSHYHFGGILADDMGLGKTLQAITFLLSEKEEGKMQHPALVIAPTSLIYNWEVECQKFAPELKVLVVNGAKNMRQLLIEEADSYDIVITSYGSFRSDYQFYAKNSYQYLILDEAQMVKNSATKIFSCLRKLEVGQRFALTGTPIENSLEELWSIFYLLMPGFFPSRVKFRKIDPKEIGQIIRPFVLRREKKEVLKDLPDKIETNLYSELTEEQKVVYLANLEKMQREVLSMDSETLSRNKITILTGLTRLRQVCCDPSLFLEDYEGKSGKLEQLKEIVTSAHENGRRILIFSQFTRMLTRIEHELEELAIETFYIQGKTPAKERIQMVDAFNAGERDVFLISLKAGGTGLNLTGADTVILYDLWWNPAVEDQAASRAHRLGQKKVVEVWRLISKGTIEERIYKLQKSKKELFQKVISQEQDVALKSLTEEDIRQILNIGLT